MGDCDRVLAGPSEAQPLPGAIWHEAGSSGARARSPRRRRPSVHRSRRPRLAAEGLLLQLDGSRHDWLEGRGPMLTLVGAIDDATGKVTAAVFRLAEDTAAYLEVLATTVRRYGIPGAVYHDRHGSFAPTTPGLLEPRAEGPLLASLAGRSSSLASTRTSPARPRQKAASSGSGGPARIASSSSCGWPGSLTSSLPNAFLPGLPAGLRYTHPPAPARWIRGARRSPPPGGVHGWSDAAR